MTDQVQPSRSSSRQRRKNLYVGLTALFMGLYGASVVTDLSIDANLFWLTAAFIVAAIGFACLWVRALDEAQMQAQYVSWYWGGSMGLSVSALVFIALMPLVVEPGAISALFPSGAGPILPNLTFSAGFMLGILPAVIGYLIWWTVVFLRRG